MEEKKPRKKRQPAIRQFPLYLRNLDKWRWEYLRESDKFRTDWKEWKVLESKASKEVFAEEKKLFCGACTHKESCGKCEYNKFTETNIVRLGDGVTRYLMEQGTIKPDEDYSQQSLSPAMIAAQTALAKLRFCYGLQTIANPDLDYATIYQTAKNQGCKDEHNYIFYKATKECGITRRIYQPEVYESMPLMAITVNYSLQANILIDEFRRLIKAKRDKLKKSDKAQYNKWLLPKNVHFDTLEVALKQYRMHKYNKKMSYRNIALALQKESGSDFDSILARVRKNVPNVGKIIKRAEKGIFADFGDLG